MQTSDIFRRGSLALLPGVWTQVIAAASLLGFLLPIAELSPASARFWWLLAACLVASSMAYLGGVCLYRVCSAERGRRAVLPGTAAAEVRLGAVERRELVALSIALLSAACVVVVISALQFGATPWPNLLAMLSCAAAIVRYNLHLRDDATQDVLAPFVFGAARAGAFLTVITVFLSGSGAEFELLTAGSATAQPMPAIVLMSAIIFFTGSAVAKFAELRTDPRDDGDGGMESTPLALWPGACVVVALGGLLYLPELLGSTRGDPVFVAVYAACVLWFFQALSSTTAASGSLGRAPDPERACLGLAVGMLLIDAVVLAATADYAWCSLALMFFAVSQLLQPGQPGSTRSPRDD